ncbi:MAG: ATP-dependent RecD-like DNA helicase [Erysipelotrichaceae bacterium]|nr:ATP-dependent RecD-like DNA helicase [Erysipelotrichaceae bacterium]
MDDLVTIKGKFFHIIYHQENNLFTVARFKLYDMDEKDIIVTGYLPKVALDTLYILTGHYQEHPKYGMQFAVTGFDKQLPTDLDSIISYLSSPMFPGIGRRYAELIVETLGSEALLKIRQEPGLIDTLPKINEKKKKSLIGGICEQDDLKEAVQFFSTHGLGIRNIMRLDRIYGKDALKLVKENPYRLVEEVDGIGFKTADKLALSMGFEYDDQRRIEAAVLAVLLEKCVASGDSYLLMTDYLEEVQRYLKEVSFDFGSIMDSLQKRRQLIVEKNRVYHYTQYDAETFIADFLSLKQNGVYEYPEMSDVDRHIAEFQQEIGIVYDDKQIEAIKLFFKEDAMILTGGPGTGKTTVVRAMVELFKRIYPYMSIAVCAPTGRAAKRLSELTNVPATTIHRLLQWDLETNTFGSNENNPLTKDLLIVDEFSMVDQWLFYNLLKAGKNFKKILIIGDEDQLPSVGIGCVLKDIIASEHFPLIRLERIFRQAEGSDVIKLAHQVKKGECGILENGHDVLFRRADQYEAKQLILALVDEAYNRGYGENDVQVLAPKYSGVCGIDALNMALQKSFNPPQPSHRELKVGFRIYRENDKILQLKNQPDDDVYNGDIGILREIVFAGEGDARYNTLIVDFDGIIVEYTPENFINITHAYCVSIHKAQGSEYPIVIIPVLKQDIRMLSRRLLYTGITRASRSLVLVGSIEVFLAGINTKERYERHTTLTDRILQKQSDNNGLGK